MKFEQYLMDELDISQERAKEVSKVVKKYKEEKEEKKKTKKKLNIKVPDYTLGEELFNSISHGIGALFSLIALIFLVVKAHGVLEEITVTLFGVSMIFLYVISCVYHALSRNLEGKKVLRVIDHCNVYLLVYGTYVPIMVVGVRGLIGWLVFLLITAITVVGIVLTAVKIDKTQVLQVLCHLVSGWGALLILPTLYKVLGSGGLFFLITGGIMYSIGSILYAIGHSKRYMHCVFHVFCLLGTLFHFFCIYLYVL